MAKFQDKERILKAAKDKHEVTYKGAPIRLATDFSMETPQGRRELQKNIPINENHWPATKTTLPSKALNRDRSPKKSFPDKTSLKEYISTKPALQEMLKGLL